MCLSIMNRYSLLDRIECSICNSEDKKLTEGGQISDIFNNNKSMRHKTTLNRL